MATDVNVAIWQDVIDSLNVMIDELGQECELQTRRVTAPTLSKVDYREVFTKFATIKLAIDSSSGTSQGNKTFDSVGVDTVKTHDGYFEFIENVTDELWLLYKSNRYKIVTVEDIGELNGIIKLELNFKGSDSKGASKA